MQQLRNLANRLTTDTLAPEERRIGQQGEIASKRITGFQEALSSVLGGIAPGIEGSYRQAAETQGALGQGFADGMRMIQSESAGGVNSLLDKIGAPEGQRLATSSDTSNVLYGLGGAGPGSTLNQQGAAFGAAARMLPGTSARQGQEDLTRLQYEQQSQLADLRAKRPEIQRQMLQDLLARELDKAGYRINAGYLGNAITGQAQDFALGQAGLAQDAAEFEAGLAQDASSASQEKRDKRENAITAARKDGLTLAQKLAEGVKVRNPNFGNYGEPEFIQRKLKWGEARTRVMRAVAPDLARYNVRRPRLEKIVRDILRAAGFRPPRKSTPPSPASWGSGQGGAQ